MLRIPRGGQLAAAVLACVAWAAACSSDRSVGELHSQLTGGGGSDSGGKDASAGASGAAGESCLPHGVECAASSDCCSRFCVAGTCIDPRRCRSEGIECEKSSVCCSGRCEKELGSDEMTCAEHCFADGIACGRAYDC